MPMNMFGMIPMIRFSRPDKAKMSKFQVMNESAESNSSSFGPKDSLTNSSTTPDTKFLSSVSSSDAAISLDNSKNFPNAGDPNATKFLSSTDSSVNGEKSKSIAEGRKSKPKSQNNPKSNPG